MVDLLLRRREMMTVKKTTPSVTLIYELASPTNTASYDTGVKLFDTAKSFTILCEAKFANRNWTSSQTIFGLGTGWVFRVGRATSANEYTNGAKTTSNVNRYTAFVMNNTSTDSDTKKMTSLFARMSNTTAQTKRFAVRYNHTTHKAEGMSDANANLHAPSNGWWNIGADYISDTTLKLNMGSANSTVNILKIYNGLLDDATINSFIDKT